MRISILLVVVLFSSSIAELSAQRYGEWNVPCNLQLGPRFSAPFQHGVIFEGKEFLTSWISEISTTPLPPLNWYVPTPNPNPRSTDRKAIWTGAGVYVRCWVERNPYMTTHHRDPIGYRGSLTYLDCDEKWSSGEGSIYEASYDPTSPLEPGCAGGTGDNGWSGIQYLPGDYTGGETVDWSTGVGNGGTSVCGELARVEFICIDVYNELTGTWEVWTCGYATTC